MPTDHEPITRRAAVLIRRTWPIIAAILAFLGVLIAYLALRQADTSSSAQDAAQSTLQWIQGEQLHVQQDIATLLAERIESNPTATALAVRVDALDDYATALANTRVQIAATLPASTATASFGVKSSQIPGIVVELVEFRRSENTIVARMIYSNTGSEERSVWVTNRSYLLDEATQDRRNVTSESNPLPVTIAPGAQIEVWARFALQPNDAPSFLTLVLPDGVTFDHLPVQ